MRILLVEDDVSVATVLKKVLTDEHYTVDVATDGQAGWQFVSASHYDLIVLDVVLPKLDGLAFCRRLRELSYHMPVLLVTALNSSTKKIAGLNAGADDYITKPFEIEELLARVRVLLRRVQTAVLLTLKWEKLRLQPNSREVTYDQQRLNLTPKEYALLELFLRHSSQVFSRRAILDNLWSYTEAPGEETVTSHIKGLRRKLSDAGAPTGFIETVYGVGYRLNVRLGLESSHSDDLAAKTKSSESDNSSPNEHRLDERDKTRLTQRDQLGLAQRDKMGLAQRKTMAVLASLWNSVKHRQRERIDLLKNTLQQAQKNTLSDDMRQAGYQAAHSLTGVLGIFGLNAASDIANEIQVLLQGEQPLSSSEQQQLQFSIMSLAEIVDQAVQASEPLLSKPTMPPVVLIDPRLCFTPTLVNALWEKGLVVKVSSHFKTIKKMLNFVEDNRSSEQPNKSDVAQPDVILYDFSLADASGDQLKQLSELVDQIPALMLLVCSADGTLKSRVKASQLGSYPFLYKPDVEEVVKGIELLLAQSQNQRPKILAVDDDPQILDMLQTHLEPQGFQIVTLNQPINFWQTLQEASPDLLLLDISMPEFSGLELCQAVRQAPSWNKLPIVFLTSHADAQIRQAVLRAGANDLLEKSSSQSELLSHLSAQIKRSHIQQAICAIANAPSPFDS